MRKARKDHSPLGEGKRRKRGRASSHGIQGREWTVARNIGEKKRVKRGGGAVSKTNQTMNFSERQKDTWAVLKDELFPVRDEVKEKGGVPLSS